MGRNVQIFRCLSDRRFYVVLLTYIENGIKFIFDAFGNIDFIVGKLLNRFNEIMYINDRQSEIFLIGARPKPE